MTLRDFRKLLHGVSPDAEVVISVSPAGHGTHVNCTIDVVERNLLVRGRAQKVVDIKFSAAGTLIAVGEDTCNS